MATLVHDVIIIITPPLPSFLLLHLSPFNRLFLCLPLNHSSRGTAWPAGSMVPFSLRLLHAQLPTHQNSPQLSLDRLCRLQTICEQVLAEINHGRLPNQPHPLTSHDQQGKCRKRRNIGMQKFGNLSKERQKNIGEFLIGQFRSQPPN